MHSPEPITVTRGRRTLFGSEGARVLCSCLCPSQTNGWGSSLTPSLGMAFPKGKGGFCYQNKAKSARQGKITHGFCMFYINLKMFGSICGYLYRNGKMNTFFRLITTFSFIQQTFMKQLLWKDLILPNPELLVSKDTSKLKGLKKEQAIGKKKKVETRTWYLYLQIKCPK